MRSRSSLLGHILGSNPEISGYAELSLCYRSLINFIELRYKVWELNDHKLQGKYVLDKILHNRYEVSATLLSRPSVYILYLVREPEDSIKSIMKLSQLHQGAVIWQSAEQAMAYYTSRLMQISEYAKIHPQNSYYVRSDDLVNVPEKVLGSLTEWLKLKNQLSRNYSLFPKTGKPGFGDPSKAILSGKILNKTINSTGVLLPENIAKESYQAYIYATETLELHCKHIHSEQSPNQN